MATTEDKVQALKNDLEEYKKLYEEGKKQYELAYTLYNNTKAATEQATSFLNTLNNPQYTPKQALQLAASFAPNISQYSTDINKPTTNAEEILKTQQEEAVKNLNTSNLIKQKAGKELQKTEKYVKGLEIKINNTKSLLAISSTKSLKESSDEKQKRSNDVITIQNSSIKANKTKSDTRKATMLAMAASTAKSAIFYTASYFLNRELIRLSNNVAQLNVLVDKTNEIISSIKTKQDVIKAKVARDAALVELNSAYTKIKQIRDVLQVIQTILTIITILLNLILLFPIPVTPKTSQQITKLTLTLDAIVVFLSIATFALGNLLIDVDNAKARLLPISDLIDEAINNNLSPEEIRNLLANSNFNNGKLGLVEGVVYRGFTFAIYEENDPRYVIAGNKRRYAVAYDRSGFMVLQSQPSFTLDPNVLIEELKLIIDEQNLEP